MLLYTPTAKASIESKGKIESTLCTYVLTFFPS